ncbi:MAG: FAD binding domain-containing protein [Acidimicrobiia bacterium]|nr:FAD binding domain-containing protein [Acidimicrobiia bacterium]
MKTISVYHRPDSLDEAVLLLERPGVTTTLIAGGTTLNTVALPPKTEVVDIQDVVTATAARQGDRVVYGAMLRLADLIAADETPPLLAELAKREGPNTLRNAATIGGTVAEGDSESELLSGLLVHDARVSISGHDDPIPLPELFADWSLLDRSVILSVSVAIGGETASARTGRTPADTSIVAAAGRVVGGGLNVAVSGVAATPILVDPSDLSTLQPPADFRGSSEYRREIAEVLVTRVVAQLGGAS